MKERLRIDGYEFKMIKRPARCRISTSLVLMPAALYQRTDSLVPRMTQKLAARCQWLTECDYLNRWLIAR